MLRRQTRMVFVWAIKREKWLLLYMQSVFKRIESIIVCSIIKCEAEHKIFMVDIYGFDIPHRCSGNPKITCICVLLCFSVLGRMKHSHQKPTGTVQNVQVSAVPLIQPAQVATPSDEHHNDDDDEDDDDDEPAVEEGHGHGGHIHTPLAGAQHSRPARRPFRVGLKPLKHKYGRDLGGGLSAGRAVLFSISILPILNMYIFAVRLEQEFG